MTKKFEGKVHVPANLRANKQGIIGKFDLRDLAYMLVGFTIFVSVLLLLALVFKCDKAFSFVIAIGCGTPIVIAGFKDWDGLKFEEWVLVQYTNKFKAKDVRINNNDNLYDYLEVNNENEKKEIKKIKIKAEKQKKKDITKETPKKPKRNQKEIKLDEYGNVIKPLKKLKKTSIKRLLYN